MRVEIFDVNHGQCAAITAPNGRQMLIDCGERWEGSRWWAPSMYFMGRRFELHALTNLDEDHLSDFHYVHRYLSIGAVLSNPTVGAPQLLNLKPQGMREGTRGVHQWMANPLKPLVAFPDFGAVSVRSHWNPYIPGTANSTNNLSLVVVVQYGTFKIVFAGDMEESGWRELLVRHPMLSYDLYGTAVYVASHHGRENGRSDDLFKVFRPGIVIISDGKRQYDTQDTDGWYRQRCTGIPVVQSPWERRYVVTTRSDGSIRIDVDQAGQWLVTPFYAGLWDTRVPSVA